MVRGGNGPSFDGGKFFDSFSGLFRSVLGRGFSFWLVIIAVIAIIWLATGIYSVQPREQGVIRLFGSFQEQTGPGLHWRFPDPITSLERVDTESIRTATIGYRINEIGTVTQVPQESLMLTADNSIVEAQMVVQYKVGDARDFTFNVANPEKVLFTTAEVSLRSIVGRNNLVSVLTTGRSKVEQDTRLFLETLLEKYQVGILVTDVKLQTVDPPEEVKDAFQEVTRALEDETRLENEAKAYEASQIPVAKGQVQVNIREAAAYYQQEVERSTGEALRFLALLEEYRTAPEITIERLYIEAMESILQKTDKTIIDTNVEVLPLLDIDTGTPRLGTQ